MRQLEFERRYGDAWSAFEVWLRQRALSPRQRRRMEKVAGHPLPAGVAAAEVPAAYRALCAHLALARERRYAPALVDRLNRLVLDGHHALYGAAAPRVPGFGAFLRAGFPRLLRREWRVVLLASALFFGPFLGLIAAVQWFPQMATVVVGAEALAEMQSMYQPDADKLGRNRSDTNLAMFGFYVWNNVRIGFQTFAGGVLLGLGSVAFLLFNGVYLGAVVGHLTQVGLGQQIWSFVSGHSAPELIGIAISGAGGLKLGAALLAPGRRSRRQALIENGRVAFGLVAGAALLFLFAAVIEAFYSPLTLDPAVKYASGIVLWLLLLGYLGLGGRGNAT